MFTFCIFFGLLCLQILCHVSYRCNTSQLFVQGYWHCNTSAFYYDVLLCAMVCYFGMLCELLLWILWISWVSRYIGRHLGNIWIWIIRFITWVDICRDFQNFSLLLFFLSRYFVVHFTCETIIRVYFAKRLYFVKKSTLTGH